MDYQIVQSVMVLAHYCIAQQQEEWITKKEAIEDELIFLENCDELTEELVVKYDELYKLLQFMQE